MLLLRVVDFVIGTVVGYFALSFEYEAVPKSSSILKSFEFRFTDDFTLLLRWNESCLYAYQRNFNFFTPKLTLTRRLPQRRPTS